MIEAKADFVNTLMEMRRGSVAIECSKRFNELMSAILEYGEKGELTLKLSVKPTKFVGTTVAEVEIDTDIKIKKPEEQPGRAAFFVSKDGRLSREDPRQTAMFEGAEDEHRERAN